MNAAEAILVVFALLLVLAQIPLYRRNRNSSFDLKRRG